LEKLKKNLCWLLAGVTAALNLVMFFVLPARIAVQIEFSGQVSYTAASWAYLLVTALLVAGLGTMVSRGDDSERRRWLVTESLVAALNAAVIVLNLTVFAGKI